MIGKKSKSFRFLSVFILMVQLHATGALCQSEGPVRVAENSNSESGDEILDLREKARTKKRAVENKNRTRNLIAGWSLMAVGAGILTYGIIDYTNSSGQVNDPCGATTSSGFCKSRSTESFDRELRLSLIGGAGLAAAVVGGLLLVHQAHLSNLQRAAESAQIQWTPHLNVRPSSQEVVYSGGASWRF